MIEIERNTNSVSRTIMFAEHYARCGGFTTLGNFTIGLGYYKSVIIERPEILTKWDRNNSFADWAYPTDVRPVPDGFGGVLPSRLGATFQSAPKLADCDPTLPQTPHSGGMLVLHFDGSVHSVYPSVNPSVFWGAVTRDGGEVIGDY